MTNLDALSKDDLIALIQEKEKAIKSQDRSRPFSVVFLGASMYAYV